MADYNKQIVEITKDYLGPAAERFVRRQIEFHLEKSPEEIEAIDINKIAEAISVALGILNRDEDFDVDEIYQRIAALAK